MEASRVALPKVGLSAPLRLRRGGAEAERTFLLRQNTQLASIQLIEVDTAGRVIPPSRYNRPWRPLDWRNSIEVSARLASIKLIERNDAERATLAYCYF